MVSMVACAQQCKYQSDGYCTLPAAARVTNDGECCFKSYPKERLPVSVQKRESAALRFWQIPPVL